MNVGAKTPFDKLRVSGKGSLEKKARTARAGLVEALFARKSTISFAGILVALLLAGPATALGPTVDRSQLSNGATLLVSEQHNLPMVLVEVMVDAGSRFDPAGREGVAYLTADLLTEGTAKRSGAEIKEVIDFIGGSLDATAGVDYAAVSLQVLRDALDEGMDLLADVVLHPKFAAEEVARRREAVLASIRAGKDNPNEVAARAFRRALFGSEPYGHPPEGLEESVPRIAREDVSAFFAKHYRPSRAHVIVVGDITVQEAKSRIEQAFARWDGTAPPPFVYPDPPPPAPRAVRTDKPVSQASIVLGHRGIARNNPDFETVSVMSYILGSGGFSSRLMENIRTQAGLAYSVGSYFAVNQFPGSFQIVMQTKNESAAEAMQRARAEVARIRDEPVSEDELNDAKRYLTGSFPLRLDSNSNIVDFIAQISYFDLGLDYADRYIERVNAVTAADVQRVAQKYLHPDQLVEVVVADLGKAGLSNP
jgi:zinc protease